MERIASVDAVIWMDTMQYERDGFVNRNRLPDGAWMTIPVDSRGFFGPINRVRIADPGFRVRRKIAKTLRYALGDAAEPYAAELLKPYGLLIGLNYALLRLLLADLQIDAVQYFQSHLAAGAGEEPDRERLAMMVEEIGGTVWLSGPSGSRYLNEMPFHERGIEVRYFDWPEGTPNPSAIEGLRR
jgi:hypothetical protein